MQNKKKTKVDTKTDYKDVGSTSENMKKGQPLDLTTAPKENETKTVSFKTPEIIIFTEEMEKTFDISKSDTTQSDLNEGEDDTYEVDVESEDEIPCSQIIRSPHVWSKLAKVTCEEHKEIEQGKLPEEAESQEEGESQEELDTDA